MQALSTDKELQVKQDIDESDMTEEELSAIMSLKRRKRINNIKRFIILSVFLLLFVSLILNFILVYKVLNLEKRMKHLLSFDNYCVYERQI